METKTTKNAIEIAVEQLLRNSPPGAKVEVNFTPDGELVLSVSEPRKSKFDGFDSKADIINTLYSHLVGQPITLTEASEKYDVPRATIEYWVYGNKKYLAPLDDDAYPKTFDEAEVAYLCDVYVERLPVGSRAPLLEENGLPYRLKNPGLARYRRAQKQME